MCCRYYFEKDVHPNDEALIFHADGQEKMRWGFPAQQQGSIKQSSSARLIINARAESVLEKRTFSESLLRRRCVIPAEKFYEWDRQKMKNTFRRIDQQMIYMAGFYAISANEKRFVIITTDANESMRPVHDRMPLILEAAQIDDWIHDPNKVRDYLRWRPLELERRADYEQMSFF